MTKEGGPRPPGRFRYEIPADKWLWDDVVYELHGYRPGEVGPTTNLILWHKHQGDRERVRKVLDGAIRTGEPFNLYYRLIGADGVLRNVVLVGEGEVEDGVVTAISGYYLDLTSDLTIENEEAANAAVAASVESRAIIEQAKGALMLAYGLDPDAAFAMLRWWSRNRNVKVRELAEGVVDKLREGTFTQPTLRVLLDSVLDDLTS